MPNPITGGDEPGPVFLHGTRGRIQVASQYQSWDFLKGEGPASSERYHDPLEKKAFKPGWNTMRHQDQIKQDSQRLQEEAQKEKRQGDREQFKREASLNRHLSHGFNPITGQEFDKSTNSWQAASNPWAHQKVGIRPAHAIQQAEPDMGRSLAKSTQRTEALAPVVEMRRERIANGGLSAAQRRNGGVKELMNWAS